MPHLRRLAYLVAPAVLSAACASSPPAARPAGSQPIGFSGIFPPAHRRPAPAVSGRLLTGGTFSLAAQRGHVVLLNFWASWCAPCQQETAALEQAYTATAPLGVRFVGVNVADQPAKALSYERAHHVTYPSVADESASLLPEFRGIPASALPSSVIIDATGRVAAIWIGDVSAARLIAVLRGLAAAGASR